MVAYVAGALSVVLVVLVVLDIVVRDFSKELPTSYKGDPFTKGDR